MVILFSSETSCFMTSVSLERPSLLFASLCYVDLRPPVFTSANSFTADTIPPSAPISQPDGSSPEACLWHKSVCQPLVHTHTHTHAHRIQNCILSLPLPRLLFECKCTCASACTNSIHDNAIPRFPKSTSQPHTIGYYGNCCPYCTRAIECMGMRARTHTHTFSLSQTRAALYTILVGKCQWDFNPLNATRAGLQWKLCRSQSKTHQRLICCRGAVTALIHRKSPPTEHTFVPPSCPGVYSLSIIQHHII